MGEKAFVCPNCERTIFFPDSNFCCFCRHKLTKDDFKKLPVCPSRVPEGHCEECKIKKAKKCDTCGSTNEVEYRPEYGDKCLCKGCREGEAIFASMGRSY